MKDIKIIGAGLAGCEAALQLVRTGHNVTLYDSKPERLLEVYSFSTFAELVCNNSIGNIDIKTPLGLLLRELKLFDSRILAIAEKCRVGDPAFFSLDKKAFSIKVTEALYNNRIRIVNEHIKEVPHADNVIIATGPLTDEGIISSLSSNYGIQEYHFSDASSPIVDINTINLTDKNIKRITDDLYTVSIPTKIFHVFQLELAKQVENVVAHDIDKMIDFEKCQSIERIAKTGVEELQRQRFSYSYSNLPCLLLRREIAFENGFILVGCMTALRHQAQIKVFSMLPGFTNCKFIKYGRMHRNTFLNAPKFLNKFFQIKGTNTFVVGQLSGVDGYAPAIASGLVAAMRIIYGEAMKPIPTNTMIGGLAKYVSNTEITAFQPMCASLSLLDESDNSNTESIQEYLLELERSNNKI